MLTVVLGGARSGKSSLAVRLAEAAGAPVTFVATAEAGDEEMAGRIAAHRAERPEPWSTVEEPRELESVLSRLPPDECIVIDCLTLWLANVLEQDDEAVVETARRSAAAAAGRPGSTIAVTNEVGWGIVPADPVTRRYRDLLGRVNAVWATAAETALLVVAGRVLPLPHPTGDQL